MVVCIDVFQQIGYFANSILFQTELRSVWQHHEQTSYCLFGSKKHMMETFFVDSSKPFYKPHGLSDEHSALHSRWQWQYR